MPRNRSFDLPSRQIHLDFHTSPFIGDVGRDFDAREFARTMKQAHVDSVTVFAKCHHGHLYYNTKSPARHPGLKKGLDLLGKQIDALHRQGIRAPIYISVQCDEFAADTHPEWIAREADGRPVGAGPFDPKGTGWPVWQIMDMSSPYQDYLADQTREVLEMFDPVDGIFFDMCWDQTSCSKWAIEGMLARGMNPENEDDRKKYSHEVSLNYMKRFHAIVKNKSPGASVYFNGRALWNLAEEVKYQEQVEIEALPTGGWGYLYFPKNVRFARTFDRPYLGMTARFHKSWADFGGLKPYPALEYETSQMMAHGARCSIGDQLHPRGVLDAAAYDLIGRVYDRVEQREPWVKNATPLAQVGLFMSSSQQSQGHASYGTDEGAVRMLTQLRHQFDIVRADSDFSKYELLILPDQVNIDDALAEKLKAFAGAVLFTGLSGVGRLIDSEGESPFQTTYLRFGEKISGDVPATDHVMYDRGLRVRAGKGWQSLGGVVEPYFDRNWQHFSSHFQTPPDRESEYSFALKKGRWLHVPYPIFAAFANHGSAIYRLLVRNLIDLVLPEQLITVMGPTGLEATLAQQKNRTIVHLLYYSPERRTPSLDLIEDVVELRDVAVSLRMKKKPRRVMLVPENAEIAFEYDGERVDFRVPEIRGHAMVCLE
jgi:hypothetical protein